MELLYWPLGVGILAVTTYACLCCMERTHKRLLHEMQERHEQRMAEWRAVLAETDNTP